MKAALSSRIRGGTPPSFTMRCFGERLPSTHADEQQRQLDVEETTIRWEQSAPVFPGVRLE